VSGITNPEIAADLAQLLQQYKGANVMWIGGSNLLYADNYLGKLLAFEGACDVTLPGDAAVGSAFSWVQFGTGTIDFLDEGGADFLSEGGATSSGGPGAGGSAICIRNVDGVSAIWWITGSLG
jgi:hypothetical protein